MKSQYFLLMLLVLIFNLPEQVESQTLSNQIIGTWTFDLEASIESMSQQSKDYYNRMSPARQNQVKKKYQNRKITFKQDGTYLKTLANGKNSVATWIINKNQDIKITPTNGKVTYMKIKELESTRLVLSRENSFEGHANILFKYWCLTKNQKTK